MSESREKIGTRLRQLRKSRSWTQTELADQLGISQSRLSEIERGVTSLTAEQFLVVLQLFNVTTAEFSPLKAHDHEQELQNALARLGANHLHESASFLPSERLADVNLTVRETLLTGAPRLVTGLGPVVVLNIDSVNLPHIHKELVEHGMERRVAWFARNLLDAIRIERTVPGMTRDWATRYRRAEVVLSAFLESVESRYPPAGDDLAPDVLDRPIRSKRTLDDVKASSSPASRRWGIVTGLQLDDFSQALRAVYGTD